MTESDPKLLLELYLLGELDEQNSHRVKTWLAGSPEGRTELEEARRSLEALDRQLAPPEDFPQVAERIVSICRSQSVPHAVSTAIGDSRENRRFAPRFRRHAALLVGAGLIAACFLVIALVRPWRSPSPTSVDSPQTPFVGSSSDPSHAAVPVDFPFKPSGHEPSLVAYRLALMHSKDDFHDLLDKHASTLFPLSKDERKGE